MLNDLIGNDSVKRYIERAVDRDVVGNSLLFAGRSGIGKSLFARALAARMLAIPTLKQTLRHPDVHIYRPEGKAAMHSIDMMRSFAEKVHLPPYNSSKQLFIIEDADRMLPYSANALLKIFEEPTPHSVIILLSASTIQLLPTVLSRCRLILFKPIKEELITSFLCSHHQIDHTLAQEAARDSKGSLAIAMALANGRAARMSKLYGLLAEVDRVAYHILYDTVEAIADEIDKEASQQEKLLRKERKRPHEELSALQRAQIEKEIEGAVALKQQQNILAVLEIIFTWFRDLALVQQGGANKYIATPTNFVGLLQKQAQRLPVINLQQIEETVGQARLIVERFDKPVNAFEYLLLKIIHKN
ncbi:AAA family ATPase [Simkania negevensis]|uniref:AAA family ATPase n=1 Tax=Simkania negevensis TaxID=83561 RepID=A0ABS3AU29_9BACT|nr:AAA family ATPase [Simkania negevensis]